MTLLTAQLIGSAIVTSATFAISMAMMLAINAAGLLRVSQEGELQGLDLHEHGIPAYPEYALHNAATPQGGPQFVRDAYQGSVAASAAPVRQT